MNQSIIIKRSTVAGRKPSNLAAGEIAVNLVDKILYTADTNGNLIPLNEKDYVVWKFTTELDGNGLTSYITTGYKYSDIDSILSSGRVLHIRLVDGIDGLGEERLFVDSDLTEALNGYVATDIEGLAGISSSHLLPSKYYLLSEGTNDTIVVTENTINGLFTVNNGEVLYNSNEIATVNQIPNSIKLMGITPETHTLADTADSYFADLLADGEAGAWFISYSNGSLLIKPSGTETDEDGRVKLSDGWYSRLNYSGATWANVGDILLVYRQNFLISAYKILTLNEAGETRIGLMSPVDKQRVNQVPYKLPYSTDSVYAGGVTDGAYTNVTSGRTNWIDSSAAGSIVSLGNLQVAVDPSGRLYSRNKNVNNGTWQIINQLPTIGAKHLDTVFDPCVIGYGICPGGPTSNPSTVYTFSSSDLDGNGYRSLLQLLIDRNTSIPYIRATFYNPGNSAFSKTEWFKVPREKTDHFAIKALESGILSIETVANTYTDSLFYSINSGPWIEVNLESDTTQNICNVSANDIVKIKRTITDSSQNQYFSFDADFEFNVSGNIMSLLYGDNFEDKKTFPNNITTFYKLFYSCSDLISAENLILPAATLIANCYDSMFSGCNNLTIPPQLPATTLATSCYNSMFSGCSSLIKAPELPAISLADYCYNSMFESCDSLTTAPELPATTLALGCYSNMFMDSTSLTTPPAELPATTLANNCYQYMFTGCESLTTAPELPATNLAQGCYVGMFNGCSSLTAAPELPAITLAQDCYDGMFSACPSLTTAPELPAINLVEGCYNGMFNGCTHLNYVKAMFLSVPSDSPTHFMDDWLRNVSQTGTFICSNEYTWSNVASSIIPSGWNFYSTKREYSKEYFTIHNSSLNTGYFNISSTSNSVVVTISYSKNGGSSWTSLTTSTTAQSIQINAGEDVLVKGLNSSYNISGNSSTRFSLNEGGSFTISGNIMSLIYEDNFLDKKELFVPHTFAYLFTGSTKIVDASNLILPSITLVEGCYYYMFSGCSSLTTAPQLPATTLAKLCYSSMFFGCSSLIKAPELPATTLATSCYQSMFYGCSSLTTAPSILPATTLDNSCYLTMFRDCVSLTTPPTLPATTLAGSCYSSMFRGCSSLIKAPELPATTLANGCYASMFYNCYSLVEAPELPATTIFSQYDCYSNMFQGCINLSYIKALFMTTPDSTYTNNWVNGVASKGIFIKNPNATWNVTGINGVPSGWTVYTTPKDKVVRQYQLDELTNDIDNKLAPAQITTSLTPTKTKFLNKTIYNLCIPIDTTKNIYSGDSISNSSVIPFIGGVQKYLKFSKGNVLPTNYDILSAKLYGSGISDSLSTITDSNGVVSLYSLVPIEQYLSNLQYVILESIDTVPTISGMWINNYGSERAVGYNFNKNAVPRSYGYMTWEEFVDNMLSAGADTFGANEYYYTNETFEWDGGTYYLWEGDNLSNYILTTTISYDTLYDMSIEADYSNENCPYVAFLTEEKEVQYVAAERQSDWLIQVFGTSGGNATRLFIDDFMDVDRDTWTQDMYSMDWDEFVSDSIDDTVGGDLYQGAKHFLYDGETFEWNGETYSLLTSANDTHDDSPYAQYLLADSVDYNYLYSMSLEADFSNGYCPYVAILDEEMENYGSGSSFEFTLIKVEQ